MNLRLIPHAIAACFLLPAFASAAEPASDSQFLIGGGIGAGPRYSGANENAVAPVVVLDYSHASGFFASTLRGVGYGSQEGPFSYSAALGYRGERKEKNQKGLFGATGSGNLKGMGDVKGSATAIFSVGYKPLPMLELSAAADIPLSQRENGKNFHTSATAHLLDERNDHVSLGLSAGIADSQYAKTYYGVSTTQATMSKFAAYQPKAGLYEAGLMLTWQHRISEKWNVTSMLGANHLLRDSARSPITERKTSPTGAVYLSYAY